MKKSPSFLSRVVINLIVLYQKTLSFDHGFFRHYHPDGYCRFYPSCSEYTRQAIREYGLIKGGFKGFLRILRCHPFSAGGFDPVKKN